ncbi:MAG TPA: restriction endonuclease subunit S, partial [Bacteroidales bacterium]|nr:restriction endonuclease subunit S [Bacteroidales bacterium]
LKVYRQSLLKWAFEGRLTSTTLSSRPIFPSVAEQNKAVVERSRNHRSKVVTTASLAAEEKEKYGIQNELPEGWKWVKIDVLLADKKKGMSTGPFGTMLKKSEHQKNGVPVLGIENIGEGIFQMPNKIFITNEKAFELKNFRVKDNDIIISRSGTVGEICLLPKRMENAIISTNLIRVRLNQDVIYPKYFVYLFQGGRVRQQVFDLCKGSSRIFLNQTILNSLEFPFCSLEEQQLIVDELESRLTVCDKIEETITNGLQQSEALRQSILKKAFEGKLIR